MELGFWFGWSVSSSVTQSTRRLVILLSVPQARDHLINAISAKRKRGGCAQSNATLAGVAWSRLGLRERLARSKVLKEQLFPSNLLLLFCSVPCLNF